MIVLFSKIIHLIKSLVTDSKIKDRQDNNTYLRANRLSDVNRWSKNEELFQDWDERTKLLGDFIYPKARIIEFGAGNMILKKYLKNYNRYTATDVVRRYDETIVLDLNEPINFDFSNYDTAVCSGVLEYVYDIEPLFAELSTSVNQIVLSYACSDIVELSRDKNGWLSDYSKCELEKIFEKYNYRIENYMEWRKQCLFNLLKR